MARIRTIKPEFFKHADLYDLEVETGLPIRLAYAGLWTVADREGRFKWKPRDLKTDCLPHDEIDFSRVLDALSARHFVERYEVDGEHYGWIPSFLDHQFINNRESKSRLPEPPNQRKKKLNKNNGKIHASGTRQPRDSDALATRGAREGHAPSGEGKGSLTTDLPPYPQEPTQPGHSVGTATLEASPSRPDPRRPFNRDPEFVRVTRPDGVVFDVGRSGVCDVVTAPRGWKAQAILPDEAKTWRAEELAKQARAHLVEHFAAQLRGDPVALLDEKKIPDDVRRDALAQVGPAKAENLPVQRKVGVEGTRTANESQSVNHGPKFQETPLERKEVA